MRQPNEARVGQGARERGLSVAELRALEGGAEPADARRNHGRAVPFRHGTTDEERFATPAVLQAHEELHAALRGLADARIAAVADAVRTGSPAVKRGRWRARRRQDGLINAVADAYGAEAVRARRFGRRLGRRSHRAPRQAFPRRRWPRSCCGGRETASAGAPRRAHRRRSLHLIRRRD